MTFERRRGPRAPYDALRYVGDGDRQKHYNVRLEGVVDVGTRSGTGLMCNSWHPGGTCQAWAAANGPGQPHEKPLIWWVLGWGRPGWADGYRFTSYASHSRRRSAASFGPIGICW